MTGDKISTKEELFEFIASSSIYGNLGFFVGAGLPMAILNTEWQTVALSWKELVFQCAESLNIDLKSINKEGMSYPDVATQLCKLLAKESGVSYEEATRKFKVEVARLTSLYPSTDKRKEYNSYFSIIDPSWIITTNYDLVIESILTGKGYSLTPNDQLIAPKDLIPVYHLHGIRTDPNSIIITQEDYIKIFRPNQYRQQKLPLTIKESLTLLLGYNLGDFNVLTAVDWSRNVFTEQSTNYPQGIIQFYYTSKPSGNPYQDHNNITIFEFDNLSELLSELSEFIKEKKEQHLINLERLNSIEQDLLNPDEDIVVAFMDDEKFRRDALRALQENDNYFISGFLELFSKSIDLGWTRSAPSGAFFAYNQCLILLLDVLEYLNIKTMPPALIELVTYNFDRISGYVGKSYGKSHAAGITWDNRKNSIPIETKIELINIAKIRQYHGLVVLLNS